MMKKKWIDEQISKYDQIKDKRIRLAQIFSDAHEGVGILSPPCDDYDTAYRLLGGVAAALEKWYNE